MMRSSSCFLLYVSSRVFRFHIVQHVFDSLPFLSGSQLAVFREDLVDIREMSAFNALQKQSESLVLVLLQNHFIREKALILRARNRRRIELQHVLTPILLRLDHTVLKERLQRPGGHATNHQSQTNRPERIVEHCRRRRERHVVHDVATLLVRQSAGATVADPDVDATTPGVDEQNVFEAEFLGENVL